MVIDFWLDFRETDWIDEEIIDIPGHFINETVGGRLNLCYILDSRLLQITGHILPESFSQYSQNEIQPKDISKIPNKVI